MPNGDTMAFILISTPTRDLPVFVAAWMFPQAHRHPMSACPCLMQGVQGTIQMDTLWRR